FVATEPTGVRADVAGPGVQYSREFHDEYELAGVWRGINAVVFIADGGVGVAQFCVCRGGHRAGSSAGARDCAKLSEDAWELLGGPGAGELLPAAAAVFGLCALPGVAGDDPEFQAL